MLNTTQPEKIILALGGSSGAIYAKRILDKLTQQAQLYEVNIVMSKNAAENWKLELPNVHISDYPFKKFSNDNFYAPFASGSAMFGTMIVCPCSMGLLARISQGISQDLITRAADVILKERRKLILVPRETPFSLIHLRNMTNITEAGGIICPAMPSFYSNPQTKQEIVDTVVDRILDLAGLGIDTYRWGGKNMNS